MALIGVGSLIPSVRLLTGTTLIAVSHMKFDLVSHCFKAVIKSSNSLISFSASL